MTLQFRAPAGLTAAQEAKARQDFEGLQKLIDAEGWAIATAVVPPPPGVREPSPLYVHYTVGLTAMGRHELCLQSRVIAEGQRLLALLGQMMLRQPQAIPLDDGDRLWMEGMQPMRIRHQRNLRPFTQVTMRYTFPRVVELLAPGAP